MKENLFSIIVPVYKVEQYLNQCVDSLLNQTFTDFEVILVDDGSPDNCPKICDEYALKDSRVKVVHKKNGGLSDARNEGVKHASGKYLLFVDSDDYYGNSDFLRLLSEKISEYKTNLVFFPFRNFSVITGEFYDDEKYAIDDSVLNNLNSKETKIKKLIESDKLQISAYSYAINREFFINNQLFFEKGIFSEDIEWAMRLLTSPSNLSFLSTPGIYSRRGRVGSITSSMKHKNINDLIYIIDKYSNKFSLSTDEIDKLLLNYMAYQFTIILGLLYRVKDKKFEKETIKRLKNYKFLLSYTLNPKVKKVSVLSKFLGLTLTAKVLQFYLKTRR